MGSLIYFTVLNIYCTENTERLCKFIIAKVHLNSKFSIFDEKKSKRDHRTKQYFKIKFLLRSQNGIKVGTQRYLI